MLIERLPVLGLKEDLQDGRAGGLGGSRVLAQPVLLLQVEQAFQRLRALALRSHTELRCTSCLHWKVSGAVESSIKHRRAEACSHYLKASNGERAQSLSVL